MSSRNGNDWYEQQNRGSGTRSRRSSSSYRSSSRGYNGRSYTSSSRNRRSNSSGIVIAGWRFSTRAIVILLSLIAVLFILLLSAIIKKPKPAENTPEKAESSTVTIDDSVVVADEGSYVWDSLFGQVDKAIAPEAEEEPAEEEEPVFTIPDDASFAGLAHVSTESIPVDRYFTYGTHFYLSGKMSAMSQVRNMELVLRPAHLEIDLGVWKMTWTTDGDLTNFSSAPTITEGPNLETIPPGEYAWLIKLTSESGDVQYRTLRDETGNSPIEYYTITRDGKNNQVMLETLQDSVHDIRFMGADVQEAELPEDVYDFVIDPGHGGNDGGCSRDEYTERDLVLSASLKAYDILTSQGYKVWLTRDGSESPERWMALDMYEEDGRVTTSCRAHAKYEISVHINSVERTEVKGYQIYGTVRGNNEFGIAIADSMAKNTSRSPSESTDNRQAPGVYVSTYTGYVYDGLFNNTDALFMLRETGGIATGASSGDGTLGTNQYQNSIQGIECDLLEIGYITNDSDFEDMKNNNASYGVAVAEALDNMAKSTTLLNPSEAEVPGGSAEESAEASSEENEAEEESSETSLPDDVVPVE